jgi:hypothetical protein
MVTPPRNPKYPLGRGKPEEVVDRAGGPTVATGENINVPLNSALSITFPIESIEAVDRTPTGSHVALLVAESNEVTSARGAERVCVSYALFFTSAAHRVA